MEWYSLCLWITIGLILIVIVTEIVPQEYIEGFTSNASITVGDSPFWAKMIPRRGDIGPDDEEDGFLSDKRYFQGYTDVQRLGVNTDFCRMVQRKDDEKEKFIACALGGTDHLSSVSYRTPSVKQGFVLGRDDYMRDVQGDGINDYCRVVKIGEGTFESKCNQGDITGFRADMVVDPQPPIAIRKLLKFYDNAVAWLRLRDDMVDYAQNLYVSSNGDAGVDESVPNPEVTQGLTFNGIDQYLRIGDDRYLSFGNSIQLRNVRAFMMWVKFDSFTNNAHIFDFGNGDGIDNVFLGIMGRGDSGASQELVDKEDGLLNAASQKPTEELSIKLYRRSVDAEGKTLDTEPVCLSDVPVPPKTIPKVPGKYGVQASTAPLLYEVWEKSHRKMQIRLDGFFPKGQWVHVCITAKDNKSLRPDLHVYRNGELMYTEFDGWLPQRSDTSRNYIGKSNWNDATSLYENKDELFKGSLFDYRMYRGALSKETIVDSYTWGKKLLGIKEEDE